MNPRIPLVLSAFLAGATPAGATDASAPEGPSAVEQWRNDPSTIFEAADVSLEDFLWIARPVVVFADTPADPRFRQQIERLEARPAALADRDVVVITDTDPSAKTEIRKKLRPRGFMLAILGKDGGVKLRKPLPWDVREITRSIDKMPLRRQEIRDRATAN